MGDEIFKQCDTEKEPKFYIIVSGKVDVVIEDKGTVKSLTVGDYFGEISIMENKPRSATCVAMADTTVAFIDSFSFKNQLVAL